METEIRIGTDLTGEVKSGPLETVGIQTYVQQDGNYLLSVKPHPDAELMDRTRLAGDHKVERLFLPLHLICHIIKRLGTEYVSDNILNVLSAHPVSRKYVDLLHEDGLLLSGDTPYIHALHDH